MITIFIINMDAEVIIRHYETTSEDEACSMLVTDWMNGEIIWENENTNEAFTNEILKGLLDSEFNDYAPQYKNEVRVMEWYCGGETNFDDEIVWLYFIHSDSSKFNLKKKANNTLVRDRKGCPVLALTTVFINEFSAVARFPCGPIP